MRELRPSPVQRLLRPPALRDVLADDQRDRVASRPTHHPRRFAYQDQRAVLAYLAQLPARCAAELAEAVGDVLLNGRSIGVIEDIQHAAADQLGDGVAELVDTDRIHREDRPL